jgi:hypothetical protein
MENDLRLVRETRQRQPFGAKGQSLDLFLLL